MTTTPTWSTHARANADPAVRADKHARLRTSAPHAALVGLADEIAASRALPAGSLPYPDPDGGGVHARALFLLADPGPATNHDSGSGLLSIDNDDRTAPVAWELYRQAGLDRAHCLHWNAVPFYIAGKAPVSAEIGDGAPWTARLLSLLPDLRTVVLMGGTARAGWRKTGTTAELPPVSVLHTVHPAPRGLNSGDGRAANLEHMASVFGRVAEIVR